MKTLVLKLVYLSGVLLVLSLVPLNAATFFGPTPYKSSADIPAGLYLSGVPTFLEDFEDGTLDPSIIKSAGRVIPPEFLDLIDSVDADDGVIDGSGLNGHSFFSSDGTSGVKFTFPPGTTAAGLVWTDGADGITFSAFGPGGVLLGKKGAFNGIADGSSSGTTAEDRFFGVRDAAGIESILISGVGGGIELDHVQYGFAAVDSVQNFALDWFTLDSGGGTSSGGVFEVSGTINQPEADVMSGGIYAVTGEFLTLIPAAATELRLAVVSFSGTELRLGFPSSSGQSYVIESRADLAAGAWAEVPGTTRMGSGVALQLVLPIAFAQPQQFYRVKQLP